MRTHQEGKNTLGEFYCHNGHYGNQADVVFLNCSAKDAGVTQVFSLDCLLRSCSSYTEPTKSMI